MSATRWIICLLLCVLVAVAIAQVDDVIVGKINGPYAFTRPEGQRFFYLYVPSKYVPNQPLPLMIYFHGYTANWTQGVELDQTLDAEANNYLLAFPGGTPSEEGSHPLGWNGGTCCLFNTTIPVDDVTFTRMMVKMITGTVSVVNDRIYAMGWSNGGFMTERLGCEAHDLFAGVAADASAVILGNGFEDGLAKCDAAFNNSSIDYIHFHGTADTAVPWIGGSPTRIRLPSALQDISRWVTRNGCDNVQMETFNDGKNFTNLIWPNCRDGTSVEFMSVWYAPHFWWSKANSGFSAADYIMKSFTKSFEKRDNARKQRALRANKPKSISQPSIIQRWMNL